MVTRPNQNNSASSSNTNGQDSFDPSVFIERGAFDGEMETVRARLTDVETRVLTNQDVVKTLKDVLENDRNIDPILKGYVEKHLDLQPLVQSAVDKMDKRLLKAFMKKGGIIAIGAIWSIALIFITTWVNNRDHSSQQNKQTTGSESSKH